jgi:hypothetical protein
MADADAKPSRVGKLIELQDSSRCSLWSDAVLEAFKNERAALLTAFQSEMAEQLETLREKNADLEESLSQANLNLENSRKTFLVQSKNVQFQIFKLEKQASKSQEEHELLLASSRLEVHAYNCDVYLILISTTFIFIFAIR